MSDQAIQRLDQKLCFAIYSTAHVFNRFYKQHLDPLGLTYPQYLVLHALWEEDAVTVKRLGEHLMLDSGTLTPLLKRLEAMGMISRKRGSEDQRQVIIALSQAGTDLKKAASAIPTAIQCSSGLTPGESEILVAQILGLRTRLIASIQEDRERP